jgi:GMP synthase (glutamine-hydrolysing)
MHQETVLVLDFGGQYNQLIARRVRQAHVYSEILPYTAPVARIRELNPKGIIFTGGPNSVYEPSAPLADPEILTLGIPILGICFNGYMMYELGWINWARLIIWLLIGMCVYFGYSRHHSRISNHTRPVE